MIYKKYGVVFRRMREQAGLSLNFFSNNIGIPKSTLSNFEIGKSMMALDKVIMCLDLMGSSLEDFENLLNNYVSSNSNILVDEILRAEMIFDVEELRKLQELAEENNFPYIAICTKAILGEIVREEVEKVTEFLYEVSLWNYKELFILYSIIEHLTTKDIVNILLNLKETGKEIHNSQQYQGYLAHILYRSITTFCLRGEKIKSKSIIESIHLHNLANTMFLRNLFIGVEGFWLYCFEDMEEGRDRIIHFLDTQYLIGDQDAANYYNEFFLNLMDEVRSQK
ncbi:Rgg/GadR/MutR family transcriptional regulator [Lactococcus garvieae]|uniref:Rgg/GadR/MutR family transcriptional regulator n=1 Tax=Lactococcus garvieae TaxID=1363 RepID=UPI003853AB2B